MSIVAETPGQTQSRLFALSTGSQPLYLTLTAVCVAASRPLQQARPKSGACAPVEGRDAAGDRLGKNA